MSVNTSQLSRRERQIMDVVYAHGGASAAQVFKEMPDAPTQTAVRTFLRILEGKGYVEHRKAGRHFIYRPTRPRGVEGKHALRRVLQTFFDGSFERAMATYLNGGKVDPAERKRLIALLKEAKAKSNHR